MCEPGRAHENKFLSICLKCVSGRPMSRERNSPINMGGPMSKRWPCLTGSRWRSPQKSWIDCKWNVACHTLLHRSMVYSSPSVCLGSDPTFGPDLAAAFAPPFACNPLWASESKENQREVSRPCLIWALIPVAETLTYLDCDILESLACKKVRQFRNRDSHSVAVSSWKLKTTGRLCFRRCTFFHWIKSSTSKLVGGFTHPQNRCI